MPELYVGLMSGTSLDGVDGVVVAFDAAADEPVRVLAHVHRPYDATLAAELLALNRSGADELHRAAIAGNAVARRYAEVVQALLETSGLDASEIRAVGAHGQTVRHRPLAFDGTGYTLQLINPALLAERCGIDVIADLRSRDLAAGGQGAPLVPAFHRVMFEQPGEAVGVLNLGGISNMTVLHADGRTIGFDCGPGNALMDGWCQHHTGAAFDAGGTWAASGRVIDALLGKLLAEPYFALPPPKSTGRDLFDMDWLKGMLANGGERPEDVQATLAELTAIVCASDVRRHADAARKLWVCGGGAFNAHLMRRIAAALPGRRVESTAARGLPPDQVEAAAFAWLARAFVERLPGNRPDVTGAQGDRVLGALYPA